MEYPQLAALLIFISMLLLTIGFYSAGKARRALLSSRLKKYTRTAGENSSYSLEEHERQDFEQESLTGGMRQAFRSISRLFTPLSWRKKAERELARAGLPLLAEEYVAIQIILVLFFALAAFKLNGSLFLALAAALAAALLPPLLIKSFQAKRIIKFNNQLGDGLTVMANSLRAGFSFMQAADTLSKEMAPPLSVEFSRLLQEIKLGAATEDALQNMLERVASRDLELLITAVKIQRQVGGNLAEILDNIGETIRERIRLKNEVKTLTAQGRISGLIIGLLPLLIIAVVFMINPAYILTLIVHPAGPFLILWAVFSELVGLMLIRRIVSIDY